MHRLNNLDEPIFMAVPKTMLTEFGIHFILESCGINQYFSPFSHKAVFLPLPAKPSIHPIKRICCYYIESLGQYFVCQIIEFTNLVEFMNVIEFMNP